MKDPTTKRLENWMAEAIEGNRTMPKSADLKEVWDQMELMYPELWRTCYPRHYSETPGCGQYYSPKEPARQLMGVGLKVMEGMIGDSERYEFIGASELVKYRVPMYWLGSDMAQAIRQTVPPGRIPWYTMPLPFPAAIFMMPKGVFVHPTEGDIAWIGYSRFSAGQIGNSRLVPNIPYGSLNGGMIFFAYSVEGGHLFHWNMPVDKYGPEVSLPDIDQFVSGLPPESEHLSGMWLYQPHMTAEDNHLMTVVAHYCFGTVMLINERPDLVTTGAHRKTVGKGLDKKEFWKPNVIGEHYKIKREKSTGEQGTHASPRFHWVKGSWRQQPYGPREQQLHRQIWIEPYPRGLL